MFATATKICTAGRSSRARARPSTRPTRPPTRTGLLSNRRERTCHTVLHSFGEARARRSSAIHFQGRSIRQVSRYTLLSGCRLPWPPSCCLYRSTPFVGSDESRVGRLVSAFGSSRIASAAYQQWPTRQVQIIVRRPSHVSGRHRRGTLGRFFRTTYRVFAASPHRLPIESSRIGRGLFVPDRLAIER